MKANYLFTMSEWARAQVLERHPVDEHRVVTAHAGINTRLPEVATPLWVDPPTLLFVGTGFWVKGLDFILSAFPQIRKAVPEARLHVVGQPKDMKAPRVLPEGVQYHGPIYNRAALDDLFRRSTALVLPSRWEALGHVTLESFAFARPVVASHIGAVPEWVRDGETGFTVPVGDIDALAHRCIQVLTDSTAAARMGLAGYERVRREGTWSACARKIAHYLALAAQEGRRW